MMTDSHLEAKGSDWIDVVWAAYENVWLMLNLLALSRWAECEELLGDAIQNVRSQQPGQAKTPV